MKKLLFSLAIFTIGCGTTSTVTSPNPIAEDNKDVLILATLIQDHLMRTNGREINLSELIQNDTLKRISNNFEKVELKTRGGYISVYYKFSKTRNNKIELTNKEKEMLNSNKCIAKDLSEQYDGEIQFAYGEKFYHIKKLIVKKDSTVTRSTSTH
jgi:hypothetical protein